MQLNVAMSQRYFCANLVILVLQLSVLQYCYMTSYLTMKVYNLWSIQLDCATNHAIVQFVDFSKAVILDTSQMLNIVIERFTY